MTLKKRLLEGNPTKFHFLVFMFLSCVFFFLEGLVTWIVMTWFDIFFNLPTHPLEGLLYPYWLGCATPSFCTFFRIVKHSGRCLVLLGGECTFSFVHIYRVCLFFLFYVFCYYSCSYLCMLLLIYALLECDLIMVICLH